jgi:hypothetical protein
MCEMVPEIVFSCQKKQNHPTQSDDFVGWWIWSALGSAIVWRKFPREELFVGDILLSRSLFCRDAV